MALQQERLRFLLQVEHLLTLTTLVLELRLPELSWDWLLVRTQSLFLMPILVRRLFQ